MTDFLNAPINDVVAAILADGTIDTNEVELLRKRLFADAQIDASEAEALFQINDAVKGKANSPHWQTLFVDAICNFLLKDEKTPGVVDENEGNWLIAKLEGDGDIDAIEKALLVALKSQAKSLPANLTTKMSAWKI